MRINIPTGGSFDLNQLIDYVQGSGRNYIIQGQTICKFADHPKPDSLDYWLRENVTPIKSDTKRAENSVLLDLVATGTFIEQNGLKCPKTGRKCKGLILVT